MAEYTMDALDREVIRELESDGRRPIREVARNLGASEATIRSRMKRLSELGILRVIAFADPREVGGSQLALISLSVQPQFHDTVVTELVAMSCTTYVSTLLGDDDLVFEVRYTTNEELWRILNHQVAALPGVRSMSTRPILKVHKLVYGAHE